LKNEGHESQGKGKTQISGKVALSICYEELGKVFGWESTMELGISLNMHAVNWESLGKP